MLRDQQQQRQRLNFKQCETYKFMLHNNTPSPSLLIFQLTKMCILRRYKSGYIESNNPVFECFDFRNLLFLNNSPFIISFNKGLRGSDDVAQMLFGARSRASIYGLQIIGVELIV